MKNLKIWKIFISLFLFCFTSNFLLPSCFATSSTGTTCTQFLKLPVSARAAALSGAYSAVVETSDAVYWNPAALVIGGSGLAVSGNQWIEGTLHGVLSFAKSVGQNSAFGIGVIYLDSGRIDKTLEKDDGSWKKDGTFRVQDAALVAGFAKRAANGLTLGGNIKSIYLQNDEENASGVAFDLGVFYEGSAKTRFSFCIQNMGPRMGFSDSESSSLPLNMKFGVSHKVGNSLILVAEVNKPRDNTISLSVGAEKMLLRILALRVGYKYADDNEKLGGLAGLSGGIGFRISNFHLDYAVTQMGDLGLTQLLSLIINF
jgi:hypothetical protein